MELSVLIPARNEMFLKHTVLDVLQAMRADTEIIVVLDGAPPVEPLPVHPRLSVVTLPKSVGQRAATNIAARISTAEFIMKLDAHCRVAEGFDVELIRAAREELGPKVVQIPGQYNLHVFDWVCENGHRKYQGPTPVKGCETCGAPVHREMVWKIRKSRYTTSWRFDRELHFQYWGEYSDRPDVKAQEISDTMSCLGACWFLSRERYWELDGLDEAHGSWGQMGTEIACKSWLSGGRLVCNKRTWFAHLFRTQGGDFGFPYPLSGSEQDKARQHSRNLWFGGQWPKAVHPLKRIIDYFAPVPGWSNTDAGLVYYSDLHAPPEVLRAVQAQLLTSAGGRRIVSVTLEPIDFGENIVLPLQRGKLTMFKQILAGLERLDTKYAFLVEHDVLYDSTHFDFTPPLDNVYYYNVNVWKVDAKTGKAVTYFTKQTSGLCANRELLIAHYRKRIALVEQHGYSTRMGFEPGSHNRPERVDDVPSDIWRSPAPNLDIRHGLNLTPTRWSQEEFRNQRNCRDWKEGNFVHIPTLLQSYQSARL